MTADYGYFYRLNVKVSHQDEFFDMNIVVACNPKLVPKFGMGAMTHFPLFYAERTKANHAIGVRPVLGALAPVGVAGSGEVRSAIEG